MLYKCVLVGRIEYVLAFYSVRFGVRDRYGRSYCLVGLGIEKSEGVGKVLRMLGY